MMQIYTLGDLYFTNDLSNVGQLPLRKEPSVFSKTESKTSKIFQD